ncbi:MAG: hypothetical protein DI537_39860 [Stutzerimonas stutzeri]|nr:MAG: hypothetical protein DI537_39860 [Stutzerimonas stutzeri]
MTPLVRLTDIQLVLLATAAQRANGSLLPPPTTLGDGNANIRKAVQSLLRRGMAAEVDLSSDTDAWRKESDRSIGVVIADAGRAAIAVEPEEHRASTADGSAPEPSDIPPEQPKPRTKSALVLDMLHRDAGATLDELAGATKWLPHTTRAALTGLRKKGHMIEKRKRGEVSCYHLAETA